MSEEPQTLGGSCDYYLIGENKNIHMHYVLRLTFTGYELSYKQPLSPIG